jgi:predicted RNA binding protein YcfA (HicA-like mRNA interferase family)
MAAAGPRETIAAQSELEAQGWLQTCKSGSHTILKHPTLKGNVSVPHPKKDLPTGTVAGIRKATKGL